MKRPATSFLAIFLIIHAAAALDLTQVPENSPEALKQAIEAGGGSVEGDPYIATESGPDGKATRVLVFPTPTSLVSLPVMPQASFWAMSGWIRIDQQPYGKSGGPIFGILFGRNDCVLALTADRWSKAGAPSLWSGSVELLPDAEVKESGALEAGEWRKISVSISGNEWQLKIGDSLSKSGVVEGDTRGALHRNGPLLMRVGSFGGAATFPELNESP